VSEAERPYGDLPVVECTEHHWWIEREDGSTAWIGRCHVCGADV
jgi:hypothetical protein